MKVIITGSTGFVGANLVKHIQGSNIGEISILNFRQALPRSLEGDVLIHLAGKAHDLKNTSNPQEYFEVNFEKTRDLFNLFLDSENRDFIYFSSVKAVADTVDGTLVEDVSADPHTPYGKSKLEAERYLSCKILPAGKRLFILRPCMIHGPGNKGNLNLLYKVVKKRIPYPLAGFQNQRSFLSIQNLNYIIEKIILDQNIAGGIYNVADDESLSTNAVIKLIGEVDGKEARLLKINSKIIRAIASLGDKLHLPLNSERLKKLTESYVVSNEKIKLALNIDKLPISSREGLLTTIKSFRSN